MPRWRALPDELDPQVREFAGQLRRLVDRSGLSIAAVADRTGYSKTSWERYLNGRLLAPKGAIVALAETEPVNRAALAFVNRLSDYLFVLARAVNADGAGDVLWRPGANR